jgi:hypothetical protein
MEKDYFCKQTVLIEGEVWPGECLFSDYTNLKYGNGGQDCLKDLLQITAWLSGTI